MAFDFNTNISSFTVFLQGILSFFSPCVLPLLPVYLGFFAGGASQTDQDGNIIYPKAKTFLNTIFFVLGISVTFFILGFSVTAISRLLSSYKVIFASISAMIMILFGLYQLGVFKHLTGIEQEKRLPIDINKIGSSPISAFILGFTFSFAWTPCIGPVMTSVLLMAGSSGNALKGASFIGIYVLGFIIPFLITGLFTVQILNFFRTRMSILKWTAKIGGALLILMGILTFVSVAKNDIFIPTPNTTTTSHNISESTEKNQNSEESTQADSTTEVQSTTSSSDTTQKNDTNDTTQENTESSSNNGLTTAFDFTLTDQFGVEHTLSDYKGKVVFLNFWATWCPPCRAEMPDIQALYEKYGENKEDVIILGVAGPNVGNEQDSTGIAKFLSDNGYTYPVAMDESFSSFMDYHVNAFPTTFMINKDGQIFGYVQGAVDAATMEDMVQQTLKNQR